MNTGWQVVPAHIGGKPAIHTQPAGNKRLNTNMHRMTPCLAAANADCHTKSETLHKNDCDVTLLVSSSCSRDSNRQATRIGLTSYVNYTRMCVRYSPSGVFRASSILRGSPETSQRKTGGAPPDFLEYPSRSSGDPRSTSEKLRGRLN